MIYLSRKEHFCAAHKLYNPKWSRKKNEKIFGLCANENFHGHNYELIVTVKGTPEPETGFLINLTELSKIIKKYIINRLDHKNLNLDVVYLTQTIPTTENLAIKIWEQLHEKLHKKNYSLYSVRLYETERNIVDYFGPLMKESK